MEAAIQSGEVANSEQALHLLEECGWCIYETTKKLYYQAKNEPRFKSIFVAQTDKTRPAPEEEYSACRVDFRANVTRSFQKR